MWPGRFTDEQNAELPSEEFLKVEDGSNFGWPYCFHDWQQGKRVLNPEYGGDGEMGRCCMKIFCGWGGVARISLDPPQEPHYGDEVEGSSQV